MARVPDLRDSLRATPGTRVRLSQRDDGETFGWDKVAAEPETARQLERLTELQDRLWAEAKRAVLVVLQGIDAAGKDGTIKKVMTAFNPQGSPVTSFKVPSVEELAHDYLWRVHKAMPRRGEVGIFNRSHYEEVLVVRVHELVPKAVWSKRYEQINAFERHLADNGTTIVKFFLAIDKEEQRERFQARYDDPTKRWKFSMGDLDERKLWDAYQAAFDDVLSKTSTDAAPWYVIPANRKWFRNLAVASILADTIAGLKPAYPPVAPDVPSDLVIE
jgi:PPK2 family polyphosphate:nucleotide phosphotransferase